MFKSVDEYIGYVYKYVNGQWKVSGKIKAENETAQTNEQQETDSEMDSGNEISSEEVATGDISSTESSDAFNEELLVTVQEIRDDLVIMHQQLAGTHLFLGVLLGAFLIAKMMDRWGVKV